MGILDLTAYRLLSEHANSPQRGARIRMISADISPITASSLSRYSSSIGDIAEMEDLSSINKAEILLDKDSPSQTGTHNRASQSFTPRTPDLLSPLSLSSPIKQQISFENSQNQSQGADGSNFIRSDSSGMSAIPGVSGLQSKDLIRQSPKEERRLSTSSKVSKQQNLGQISGSNYQNIAASGISPFSRMSAHPHSESESEDEEDNDLEARKALASGQNSSVSSPKNDDIGRITSSTRQDHSVDSLAVGEDVRPGNKPNHGIADLLTNKHLRLSVDRSPGEEFSESMMDDVGLTESKIQSERNLAKTNSPNSDRIQSQLSTAQQLMEVLESRKTEIQAIEKQAAQQSELRNFDDSTDFEEAFRNDENSSGNELQNKTNIGALRDEASSTSISPKKVDHKLQQNNQQEAQSSRPRRMNTKAKEIRRQPEISKANLSNNEVYDTQLSMVETYLDTSDHIRMDMKQAHARPSPNEGLTALIG